MHNLDRALQEFTPAAGAFESASYELEGEDEGEYEGEGQYQGEEEYEGESAFEYQGEGETEYEAVFDEVEEMEQAAALLEVQDEEELDHFLGGLIRKAAGKLGSAIPSHLRKALSATLKNVARSALPMAGTALGNWFAPGVGGAIGGRLASGAGKMFGLELEGMSQEDQQFEVARRVVSLGAEAAKAMAQGALPPGGAPLQVAKDVVLQAARTHAPGLASAAAGPGRGGSSPAASGYSNGAGQRTGRWVRRGRRIILYGL